jgi:1-acyl-sn-glycerol-3-phosphate acyltransferase
VPLLTVIPRSPVLSPAATFEFPPSYARRHGRVTRMIGRTLMRLSGWKFEGTIPDVPKLVITVAPHTSNWDFVVGVMGLWAVDIKLAFIGKHTLFRGLFGRWMRNLGGIPVDRRQSHGVVGEVIAAFDAAPRMVFALAPEGTRARDGAFKTGFLRIAHGAKVPILPAYFDFATRTIGFGPLFETTGDVQADLEHLLDFYTPVQGKRSKAWQDGRRAANDAAHVSPRRAPD